MRKETRSERAERRAPVVGFLAGVLLPAAAVVLILIAISWLLTGMHL